MDLTTGSVVGVIPAKVDCRARRGFRGFAKCSVVSAASSAMLAPPERHDTPKTLIAHAAIAGVTFQAAAGEVLEIVVPNGAGKTTVLEAWWA